MGRRDDEGADWRRQKPYSTCGSGERMQCIKRPGPVRTVWGQLKRGKEAQTKVSRKGGPVRVKNSGET